MLQVDVYMVDHARKGVSREVTCISEALVGATLKDIADWSALDLSLESDESMRFCRVKKNSKASY